MLSSFNVEKFKNGYVLEVWEEVAPEQEKAPFIAPEKYVFAKATQLKKAINLLLKEEV